MAKNPKVVSIVDYIIKVSGSFNYKEGQFFVIKNKPSIKALVLSANENSAYLLVDAVNTFVEIGDEIIEKSQFQNIETSEDFFGKIVNINNEVIYPKNEKQSIKFDPKGFRHSIFEEPVGLMERENLSEQLYTGIIAIDLFNPIGLGQRESIVGDKKTGKTHIALNAIMNQNKTNVKCIYVSIGQNNKNVSFVYKNLKESNSLKNTIIFEAAANSAFQQFLIPYIAMAHAENLSHKYDVLIVFDDLTKHANIYREIALLINKPIGKEAFPGDIFFAHSRLLERSGKFIGRKSITALPILKTIDGDITSLIASNAISISDGQIITSSNLFAKGHMPAIDINLSVSRTGSSVQKKNISKISGALLKIYYSFVKQIQLSSLNYDLNDETSKLMFAGQEIQKLLIQKGFQYHSDEITYIITKIIAWGILRNINESKEALKFILTLIKHDYYGKKIYKNMIDDVEMDDFVIKNYFLYALKQYFDHKGIENKIAIEQEFIKFSPKELETLISKIEEVK